MGRRCFWNLTASAILQNFLAFAEGGGGGSVVFNYFSIDGETFHVV